MDTNRGFNNFSPKTNKVKSFDFVGFDVETYINSDKENIFYLGGLYYYNMSGLEVYEYFYDRESMIKRLTSYGFRSKYIVATNLTFDFLTLFSDTKYFNDCDILWRDSDILAVTFKYRVGREVKRLKFIDTLNYAPFSVKKLGEILGVEKLESPEYLGERKPKSVIEEEYMKAYNKRDAKISCDFMYFLQKGVNEIGGTVKLTIASTSLDTFRRGFQKQTLVKEEDVLGVEGVKDFIFKGYYGGRTEAFMRGEFNNDDINGNFKLYDVNSLYPYVMLDKKLPFPNSVFIPSKPTFENILYNEGVSKVKVTTPDDMYYPILPLRINGKLKFPIGTFTAVYNHNELRYAIENGYRVDYVYSQVCYNSTFKPFKDYIRYLYNNRLEYKQKGSSYEIVNKLLMNSLYGKFAQRYVYRYDIFELDKLQQKEFEKALFEDDTVEIKNGYAYRREVEEFNGVFSFPILSSYITSYARIHLHQYLSKYNGIYCDTDSIITNQEVPESSKLGGMKKEADIEYINIVRPKFYTISTKEKDITKIKGVKYASREDFDNILKGNAIERKKFSKLKESIIQGVSPLTLISVEKRMSLEDDKREWNGIHSKPIYVCEEDIKE